jgi:hypothetical protein
MFRGRLVVPYPRVQVTEVIPPALFLFILSSTYWKIQATFGSKTRRRSPTC